MPTKRKSITLTPADLEKALYDYLDKYRVRDPKKLQVAIIQYGPAHYSVTVMYE